MTDRTEYLRKQIESAEIHGDWKHAKQCEKELRQLSKCYGCQYLRVSAVASIQGDGYGSTFTDCDPPEGECLLDR